MILSARASILIANSKGGCGKSTLLRLAAGTERLDTRESDRQSRADNHLDDDIPFS